jgi:hypothetical protein
MVVDLTFRQAANHRRLVEEINAIPGVVVPSDVPSPIPGVPSRRSLVSLLFNDTDGTVRVIADEAISQTVIDRIKAAVAAHDATPDPPPVTHFSDEQPVRAVARTTSAAPVELWRLPMVIKTGYRLKLDYLAVDAGNGAIKSRHTEATVERINAGPLLIGRTDDAPHATTGAASTTAGLATWTLDAAFSTANGANDLVLSAIGATGRNVDWLLYGTMLQFSPGGR